MKRKIQILGIAFAAVAFVSCNNYSKSEQESKQENQMTEKATGEVITAGRQAELTPDAVIDNLKEGNMRYVNNDLMERDLQSQIEKTSSGQYPQAIILSCVDSRVPVEYVFDQGVGDIFVARVAGNFVNEDMLGSMEFACKVAGSKTIVVLGHESCGAVKATIDDVELGNITAMVSKIKPAIEMSADYEGEKTTKNPEYVHLVCKNNVHHTIEQIRKDSPVLKEMEEQGAIKIVGAIYDLDNGEVSFM